MTGDLNICLCRLRLIKAKADTVWILPEFYPKLVAHRVIVESVGRSSTD